MLRRPEIGIDSDIRISDFRSPNFRSWKSNFLNHKCRIPEKKLPENSTLRCWSFFSTATKINKLSYLLVQWFSTGVPRASSKGSAELFLFDGFLELFYRLSISMLSSIEIWKHIQLRMLIPLKKVFLGRYLRN